MTPAASATRVAAPIGPPPRSRARVALSVVIILAVVAGIAWLVAFSSVLGVRHVLVRGQSLLTKDQIVAAADIKSGTPLLRLRTGRVEARVAQLPEVSSAKVSVSYPSTVTIVITERVPVGYLSDASTSPPALSLVDRTGKAFRVVDAAPAGLPELTATDQASRLASAQIAAALPDTIRSLVASIGGKTENSIVLTLADGRTVVWGGSVRNAQKAALLPALLARDGSSIDVSAEGVAVVR